jgi:dTMP kinase
VTGRLIAIEGLDGAGKQTLVDALTAELSRRGVTSGRVAFPRYGRDVHADLVRDALHGLLGDLSGSVYGMAVLFALDRRAAADQLRAAAVGHDVLLIDRYVASNAAYGAARLGEGADGSFVAWVRQLEIERFAVPMPDLQVLLRVPVAVAADRAAGRAAESAGGRGRDSFESDRGLQQRTAGVYDQLADLGWLSRWLVVDGTVEVDAGAVVDRLLEPERAAH